MRTSVATYRLAPSPLHRDLCGLEACDSATVRKTHLIWPAPTTWPPALKHVRREARATGGHAPNNIAPASSRRRTAPPTLRIPHAHQRKCRTHDRASATHVRCSQESAWWRASSIRPVRLSARQYRRPPDHEARHTLVWPLWSARASRTRSPRTRSPRTRTRARSLCRLGAASMAHSTTSFRHMPIVAAVAAIGMRLASVCVAHSHRCQLISPAARPPR